MSTPSGPPVRGGTGGDPGGGDRWLDLGYAAGWRLVRTLPAPVARVAFDAGARYAARGGGPEQLRRNLARVLGVPAAHVPATAMRASLTSYARYWREAFRLPTMDHRAVTAAIEATVRGKQHLDAAVATGRGAVLALPHSGNWDMAGVWLVNTCGRFTTVAERLRPESLYDRFVAYRESLGFEVLPLTGGARPPFAILADRLRAGGLVCLMSDRDLTRSGIGVSLFGETTRLPAGPAALAKETGAALLPVHCWFDGPRWGLQFSPALDTGADIATITQALADRFTADIGAHPADWHMLQPQWVADLSARHRSRIEGREPS